MIETSFRDVTNNKCKMRGDGYCPKPLEQIASFLCKRWILTIIETIGNFDVLRFNNLLRRIEGITQKTLSERLQDLEKHNLVSRKAFPEKPPRVEYSLTIKGNKLKEAILPLYDFIESKSL